MLTLSNENIWKKKSQYFRCILRWFFSDFLLPSRHIEHSVCIHRRSSISSTLPTRYSLDEKKKERQESGLDWIAQTTRTFHLSNFTFVMSKILNKDTDERDRERETKTTHSKGTVEKLNEEIKLKQKRKWSKFLYKHFLCCHPTRKLLFI